MQIDRNRSTWTTRPMPSQPKKPSRTSRRKFLAMSAAAVGALGAFPAPAAAGSAEGPPERSSAKHTARRGRQGRSRVYNGEYSGEFLNRVAFPMGGIGAGMICLEGTGTLSHVSLRNRPEIFNEPCVFAAIAVKGSPMTARVLEGPVPGWKLFGSPGAGNGASGTTYGLPRFARSTFQARFPFATVTLTDPRMPVTAEITGWSPFEPGDPDASSLPVAGLEYRFQNCAKAPIEAVFSFSAKNFMAIQNADQAVRPVEGGFILWSAGGKDKPSEEGAFSATVTEPDARVNHAWFRGGWWDALTLAWKEISEGACLDRLPVREEGPSPGATLFVPLRLSPGEHRTIRLRLAWYVGRTQLRIGKDPVMSSSGPLLPEKAADTFRPWYAGRFSDINSVTFYWRDHYDDLRQKAGRFADCFYDSTLPSEVTEAVAANLTILKSPTVLRQTDGKLWAWEGCGDNAGCCHGSCTHVWNYAQAIPHLFPSLERTLRETEFGASQNEAGHQTFRSSLPIRPVAHDFHAAADGQLGGILKVYRDWRISGNTEWLRSLWPRVKQSLDYSIQTWDPGHKGVIEEPHHNTYDIEFWGPDGMCTSFYVGALQAAVVMGKALADEVPLYEEILVKGTAKAELDLFNSEYFIQRIEWKNLRAGNPMYAKTLSPGYSSPEAKVLLEREGPKYQYCLLYTSPSPRDR